MGLSALRLFGGSRKQFKNNLVPKGSALELYRYETGKTQNSLLALKMKVKVRWVENRRSGLSVTRYWG